MASFKEQFAQLLLRCQASPIFFIENFCKVKHPTAGVIPFNLFKYQKRSLTDFLTYRFNIYKKCRQCGISTLSGAFCLWYAMFYAHKTILIVSKRDEDAKAFLDKNVKFVYDHLPDEFKQVYGNPPKVYNEHSIEFPNGSAIKSLTSSKETLRSNSASLNIIDESAFMPDMETMWAGGLPTLQHGGSAIVISTTNGVGNWYHNTWEDAVTKHNDFNPIEINWWDMDWEIKYKDDLTGKERKLQPTLGIKKCETKEDIDRWGPYWSPWLEEQYRQLQQKGEAHKFRQEVLAEFIGTGNTVIARETLMQIGEQLNDDYSVVDQVPYVHPVTGEQIMLSFDKQLWVWKKPVKAEPDIIEHGRIIKPGKPGHTYVMGVDISSGEADDFSAIEIIDADTKEQVAELNIRVLPKVLLMMIDYLGRWYNGAFCVPERTGIGIPVCQALYLDMAYHNVFRMTMPGGKRTKKIGFPTTPVYKPQINKCLMDMLGEEGVAVYSKRLHQQLSIYVYTGQNTTGHVRGAGNHSDLSIAIGLSLIGMKDAINSDASALVPLHSTQEDQPSPQFGDPKETMHRLLGAGGINAVAPLTLTPFSVNPASSPSDELARFAASMGGLVIGSKYSNPAFKPKHTTIHYPRT